MVNISSSQAPVEAVKADLQERGRNARRDDPYNQMRTIYEEAMAAILTNPKALSIDGKFYSITHGGFHLSLELSAEAA